MIKISTKFQWNAKNNLINESRRYVAHQALDSQVIKDTDPFVPFRTGMLAASVIHRSRIGEIVYDTPYAKKMYYGAKLNFRKVPHPQATHRWLEKAKAIWMPRWRFIVARMLAGRV